VALDVGFLVVVHEARPKVPEERRHHDRRAQRAEEDEDAL
jgi:hypothetical protein